MTKTFLTARWENLIMANYAVETDVLMPFLPKGVELDLFEGQAYVSLVGFMFKKSRIFKLPIPLLGTFEEVNLRFYVKRKVNNEYRRGVVFINETVPYKPVAWLANKLYKEHYIAIPTKNKILHSENNKTVKYDWKIQGKWNFLEVQATTKAREMPSNSLEEFIFEHYYGYTKINETETQEYKINHPRWLVNDVIDFKIHCDFSSMYGKAFQHLSTQHPKSVIIAEGSEIQVDWKRVSI
jgi:uncharacterized protein YqjF (DUF2071 family)